jgi:hypothetical protein
VQRKISRFSATVLKANWQWKPKARTTILCSGPQCGEKFPLCRKGVLMAALVFKGTKEVPSFSPFFSKRTLSDINKGNGSAMSHS